MIYIKINAKSIRQNVKVLRSKLNPGVKVCAVVKANAYGLGDVTMSQILHEHVDWFAVVDIREAVRLREDAKITKPILLLGICEDLKTAIKHNITVSINSLEEMHSVAKASREYGRVYVHIKVNTGMNRYGISTPWQLKSILALAEKYPNVIIGGLYTHFSHETGNLAMIDRQLTKFAPFRAMIRRTHPRALVHAACSGSFRHCPAQFDMVRVGKAIYGGCAGFKTAFSVTAKIVAVQNVPKGCGVSYHSKFIADKSMTVGVVSCGYADCGFLNVYNVLQRIHLHIGKTPCKILGAPCMDAFLIDVTGIINPLGKSVTIIDDNGSSLMNYEAYGANIHHLLCSLNLSRAVQSISL